MSELQYRIKINIEYLESFIKREEVSKWNPFYYLYYPAKASVYASKAQLKGCYESIGLLNENTT